MSWFSMTMFGIISIWLAFCAFIRSLMGAASNADDEMDELEYELT